MNKLLILFLLFSLSTYSLFGQEEAFQFDNLRIVKKPHTIPRGSITSDLIPENATIYQSVELDNKMTTIALESAIFLQATQSADELIKFYELVFQTRDWRILQKDNKANKYVILGENPSKKVMTVLIRDEKDYRIVKIFYRRPGF